MGRKKGESSKNFPTNGKFGHGPKGSSTKTGPLSRKQRRKEERKIKKMRKNAYNMRVELPTRESIEEEKRKQALAEKKLREKAKAKQQKKLKSKALKRAKAQEEEEKKEKMERANRDDDRMIHQMERLLKLNKRKSSTMPQGFIDDGLDYLLEVVDPDKMKQLYDEEGKPPADWMDNLDDDLGGLGMDLYSDEDDDGDDDDNDEDDFDDDGDVDDDNDGGDDDELDLESEDGDESPEDTTEEASPVKTSTSKHRTVHSDAEISRSSPLKKSLKRTAGDQTEQGTRKRKKLDDAEAAAVVPKKQSNLKEDIYGRLRDEEGNVVEVEQISTAESITGESSAAYVPPGKRALANSSQHEKKKQELDRLKKKLKGLLNKVSESNMQAISSQIEELFRSHSRAECCQLLAEEVISGLVSEIVLTPERLAQEMVLLVAVLHSRVGSEIGGTLIQLLAEKFQDCESIFRAGPDNRQMDNIILIFCHLYNMKVLHSLLVFDLLRCFVKSFQEKDIELILLLLKTVGFGLRKDQPTVLKDIIIDIQSRAANKDNSDHFGSRVNFMLEILLAIKNNNMRKIPNYDPSHVEHLRKILRNLTQDSSSSDSQLRISLDDLLHAETRGRWWVVGSAWSGRSTDAAENAAPSQSVVTAENKFSAEILELARKQRMNTDVRRNIFCAIVTAEDFVAAFENLLGLNLGVKQEREIISVIIHLVMSETQYNPFYSYLAQKFCEYHKRFKMTLQFCLWDQFKELENKTSHGIDNLASCLIHLLATNTLTLAVFKGFSLWTVKSRAHTRMLFPVDKSHSTDFNQLDVGLHLSPVTELDSMTTQLQA